MTTHDVVRAYYPEYDDRECHWVLWEKTAYPACDMEYAEEQIAELAGVENKHIVEQWRKSLELKTRN